MYNSNLHSKILSKMSNVELAKPKDVLVVVDDRQIAEEIRQNIIDFGEFHKQEGTMERSIGVRNMGNGEYGVTAVDYAKYVNGYDREKFGNGFIDDAVDQAMIDFELEPGDIDIRYEQE